MQQLKLKYQVVHPARKLASDPIWPTAIDPTFNVAVLTIAAQMFPRGFVVSDTAPQTYHELREHMNAGGTMTVWSGGSDNTIYSDPEVNFAFRAWHDWCHWRGRCLFTETGERAACAIQQWHILKEFGISTTSSAWCRLIEAEIVGQTAHFLRHHCFPADQRAFARGYLAGASYTEE